MIFLRQNNLVDLQQKLMNIQEYINHQTISL